MRDYVCTITIDRQVPCLGSITLLPYRTFLDPLCLCSSTNQRVLCEIWVFKIL